jgi:hypothetical protein
MESRFLPSKDTGTGADSYRVSVDGRAQTLAKADARDVEMLIWSRFSFGSQKKLLDLNPTINVVFKREVSFDEYLLIICDIVSLFSLSIGYAATPFNISIYQPSNLEGGRPVGEHSSAEIFEAHYTWGDAPPLPSDPLWVGGAVLQVVDSDEIRMSVHRLKSASLLGSIARGIGVQHRG